MSPKRVSSADVEFDTFSGIVVHVLAYKTSASIVIFGFFKSLSRILSYKSSVIAMSRYVIFDRVYNEHFVR